MEPVIPPNAALVRDAIDRFDREGEPTEGTLKELFARFPNNQDIRHVLLKVIALNQLYSTHILDVHSVAQNIFENRDQIDKALTRGAPEIVQIIATIKINGRPRNNYSFASKFCNWHNQRDYPIYDSRVDSYLWRLQKQEHFCASFSKNADLWDYPKFREIVQELQVHYQLEEFSFKDIDKFLWQYARPTS